MRTFTLYLAVISLVAGCQVAGPLVTGDSEHGLTAYAGGMFTSAGDFVTAAKGGAILMDAKSRAEQVKLDAEEHREREAAELEMKAAMVKRITEGDPHIAALIDALEDFSAQFSATNDPDEQERILVVMRTTGLAIQSLAPGAYGYGQPGFGGMNNGMQMPMPTGGGFVSPEATRQPGFGAIWNRTSQLTIRGFLNGQFVGEAGPGQPIPCVAVPDGINPVRAEAYDVRGQLVGVFEETVIPDPQNPSQRKPYKWTTELRDSAFQNP